MADAEDRIRITGLQTHTLNLLKKITDNMPDADDGQRGANPMLAGMLGQGELMALTGYYNGSRFEEPKGFKSVAAAQSAVAYLLGGLGVAPYKTTFVSGVSKAAIAKAQLEPAEKQSVADDVLACCEAAGLTVPTKKSDIRPSRKGVPGR